jgi:hypothetical protein
MTAIEIEQKVLGKNGKDHGDYWRLETFDTCKTRE